MTCSRFFDAIPTPGIFVAFIVGLLAGAVIGRAWDRLFHKPAAPSRDDTEDTMNERPLGMAWLEARPRLYAFYLRYIAVIVAGIFVIIATSACGVVWLTFTRSNDNQHNAVINCENANESRKATLSLWTFLFATSLHNPQTTPQQRANILAVSVWIGKLYAQRDCSDLSRKYPIPPPPTIAAPR